MALLHRMGPEARRLRELPAFGTFSDSDLEKLVKGSRHATLPANWTMIHAKTPGDACYILLAGRVAVYVGDQVAAELGPGEVIGEVSLREKKLRTATVSTLEPVELLRIEGEDLDRLLREIPALGSAIDATVNRHVGRATTAE
ncbi:MAG: cyclic nucleotide-binding domain-containing protein [Micromonosporaceae bacterium]